MKARKPGQILSEKLKEKEREIDMLLNYIDCLHKRIECHDNYKKTLEKYIQLQEKLIKSYQSRLPSSEE